MHSVITCGSRGESTILQKFSTKYYISKVTLLSIITPTANNPLETDVCWAKKNIKNRFLTCLSTELNNNLAEKATLDHLNPQLILKFSDFLTIALFVDKLPPCRFLLPLLNSSASAAKSMSLVLITSAVMSYFCYNWDIFFR